MSADDWWYPWFAIAYRRDTRHLSLEEDGAYRRLIDEYMVTREPLPNNDTALARIVGIPKADWDRLALVVRRFFRVRNDRLYHKRCELELRKQDARHNRNSERGKKAAFARWSKINGIDARRMLAPATVHNKEKKEPPEPGESQTAVRLDESPSVIAMRARLDRRR